jgi:hypothetical protein
MDEATPPYTPRRSVSGGRSPAHRIARSPGGALRAGSNIQYLDEALAHRVSVGGFWIITTPVPTRSSAAPSRRAATSPLPRSRPTSGGHDGAHAP